MRTPLNVSRLWKPAVSAGPESLAGILKAFDAQSALIVEDKANEKLVKSARNLASSKWIATEGINVYDVLKHNHLVITRAVAKQLEERLA